MTHPQTVADIQRLIALLDEHMAGLRTLLAEGEAIRQALVADLVRISRNDA